MRAVLLAPLLCSLTLFGNVNAQDPGLPPKSRHVGADGQEIMAPDPIFPGWDEIEREILGPEMAPLWNNEKSARQWADSVVPKVNAALQAQAR